MRQILVISGNDICGIPPASDIRVHDRVVLNISVKSWNFFLRGVTQMADDDSAKNANDSPEKGAIPHETPASTTPEIEMVCLLDVLGFENILKATGLQELAAKYQTLMNRVTNQFEGFTLMTIGGHQALGVSLWNAAYFSDSILFWSHFSPFLPRFIEIIAESICQGLEMELPLRGGIAVGEAILDKTSSVYLGLPLVEVARLERAQEWIGCSVGPSFGVPPYNSNFDAKEVIPYHEHYKNDCDPSLKTGLVVDWPKRWRATRASDPRPVIDALNHDTRYSRYYTRTADFIAFSENHSAWYQELKPSQP